MEEEEGYQRHATDSQGVLEEGRGWGYQDVQLTARVCWRRGGGTKDVQLTARVCWRRGGGGGGAGACS